MAQPAASRSRPEAGEHPAADAYRRGRTVGSLLLRLRLGGLPGVALAVSRPNLACLAGRDRGAHGTPGTAMVPASSGKSRSVADHRSLAGGRPVPGAGGHRPAHPRLESFLRPRSVGRKRVGGPGRDRALTHPHPHPRRGQEVPSLTVEPQQPAGLALAAVRVRRPAHLRFAAGHPCLADIPLRSPSRARGNALGRDGPESPRSAAQHDLPGLGRGRVAARHSSGLPERLQVVGRVPPGGRQGSRVGRAIRSSDRSLDSLGGRRHRALCHLRHTSRLMGRAARRPPSAGGRHPTPARTGASGVGRDSLGRGGTGGGLASGARHLGRRLPDAERPGALFRRSGRRIRRQ